jgi:hypothetical protein
MDMRILQAALLVGMAAGMSLTAGAAMAQPAPIPPPQVEAGPPPVIPGPPERWVFEPGHWHWNGVQYVWVPRHWVIRKVGWVHWHAGHWSDHGGVWHWVPAEWGP